MQSRPRHQTLYSQCLQPHCLPAIRCPLSYPDSTRQRSALLYPFVLRLPGKLPLPRQCSTGQTRSSKNCQGKRVVLKMFWSARYCGKSNAGKYNAAGLPNVTGRASGFQMTATAGALSFVAGGNNLVYNIESVVAMYNLSVDASRSNPIYGLSDTVMPSSANLPVALYLGQPAEI